jgi:hypothetical protein
MNHNELRQKIQKWDEVCKVIPSFNDDAHTYYKALTEAVTAVKRLVDNPPVPQLPLSFTPEEIAIVRTRVTIDTPEQGGYGTLDKDLIIRKLLDEREQVLKVVNGQPVRNWLGLAERFFAAVFQAGGPCKSNETFSVTYHPYGDVAVELGTYSIGDWPRHTYILGVTGADYSLNKATLAEGETNAFNKAERKVYEAEVVVKKEAGTVDDYNES